MEKLFDVTTTGCHILWERLS